MLRAISKNDILHGSCDVYVLSEDNKHFISENNPSISFTFEEVLSHSDFVVFKVIDDEVEMLISK